MMANQQRHGRGQPHKAEAKVTHAKPRLTFIVLPYRISYLQVTTNHNTTIAIDTTFTHTSKTIWGKGNVPVLIEAPLTSDSKPQRTLCHLAFLPHKPTRLFNDNKHLARNGTPAHALVAPRSLYVPRSERFSPSLPLGPRCRGSSEASAPSIIFLRIPCRLLCLSPSAITPRFGNPHGPSP
jgi:hypothetical protein